MCCGTRCLKGTNLFFVSIFTLLCIAQILGGAFMLYLLYQIIRPETIAQLYIPVPALSLFTFGVVLLPLIFLGCCGFCKEVSCCVNLYSTILLILSVAQILMGIFTILTLLHHKTELIHQIERDFSYSLQNYQKDPFLDSVQGTLRCCGTYHVRSWTTPTLPSSCCADNDSQCNLTSESLYYQGCFYPTRDIVVAGNFIIGCALTVVGFIELFVAIMGFVLGCGSFRHGYTV